MPSTKVGFLLWPQTTSWPEIRDAAALADRSGADVALDVGPPELDRRAVGRPDPRGLVDPLGLVAGHRAGDARADGRRQHVPQPGPDGEARHDPRPPVAAAARCSGSAAHGSSASTTPSGSTSAAASASGSTGSTRPSMLVRRLLDGERVTPRRADLPDARRAGGAAAGAGAAADHDRRIRAEEDAADAGPVRRPVELDGHARQARASATRSCASTAPRSGATTRRSSGRPRSTSSSATRTRPGSPTTGRSSPPTGRSSTRLELLRRPAGRRSPRASSRSSSSGSATS